MMIRNEKGFVLVAALWLLVALAAVGLNVELAARSERLAAANVLDERRALEAAQAGAEYARSRLSAAMLDRADELRAAARGRRSRTQSVRRLFRASDPFEDPWRDPEELIATELVLGDAAFQLQVRDTGAALNLNAADEEMLRQFLGQGLQLDFAVADRITQAILDWRDEDELPRMGGAERDEYLRAGMPVLPPNRPFTSVDELRYVMGMTPEIYEAVRAHVTLIGSGRIAVNAAPEAVLLAVPGMTPAAAAEILLNRESGITVRDAEQLLALTSASPGRGRRAEERRVNARVAFSTDEVEILSEGGVVGSPVRVRVHLVVTRSDEGALVVWRRVE